MDLKNEAVKEIKNKQKELIQKFADLQVYPSVNNPFTIFTAGSPGAGKTEFSNKFNPAAYSFECKTPIVRIDADEIRKTLSQFNGNNAEEVQPATTIGMEKLFDHVNKHSQNAIVDTTFSDYNKAFSNVNRSLHRNRRVGIFYIHLDPRVAWQYTKIREKQVGRSVTKEFFIESYFKAKECVDKIKTAFPQIEIYLIKKELTGTEDSPFIMKVEYNIDSLDNYLKLRYNRNQIALFIK